MSKFLIAMGTLGALAIGTAAALPAAASLGSHEPPEFFQGCSVAQPAVQRRPIVRGSQKDGMELGQASSESLPLVKDTVCAATNLKTRKSCTLRCC